MAKDLKFRVTIAIILRKEKLLQSSVQKMGSGLGMGLISFGRDWLQDWRILVMESV